MVRCASFVLALCVLAGCAASPTEEGARAYAGRIQKVFRVTLQGEDPPFMRLLGKAAAVLGPALRQSSETLQYVVRTPTGQIMVQSDERFSVGECVEVVPQASEAYGPAFRYGEARVVRSESCRNA